MKNNLFRLDEKTAILSGPFTQLQIAITQRFTEHGCNVAIIDRNPKEAERFCEQLNSQLEINARFGRAKAFDADLTKEHHIQEALNQVSEAFGSIDFYIDGLMLFQSGAFAEDDSINELERMLNLNLKAPILLTHKVVKILRKRRKGRIIYLVSDLQRLGGTLEALNGATRNGVISLCQSLSREFKADLFTVNCVAIGAGEEYLQQLYDHCKTVISAEQELQKEFPKLKSIDAQSIADFICFLASPLSTSLNGQVLSASQGLKV